MSESDQSVIETPKKRKKGVKSKDYKHEIIKKARVKNLSYTNYLGRQCNPKIHGESCRCRNKCLDSICKDVKESIYQKFVDFDTKNEQDAYLQSLISLKRKRPRVKGDAQVSKPKEISYDYFLSLPSGRKQVCKIGFINVHGITADRVRRLCLLLACGKSPQDNRGKQRSGNAKPFSVSKKIEDHINSYPVKISHYNSKEYRYLSPKLNIKVMWEMFKNDTGATDVTYHYYLNIFKENFNLKFGQPQINTCSQCEVTFTESSC